MERLPAAQGLVLQVRRGCPQIPSCQGDALGWGKCPPAPWKGTPLCQTRTMIQTAVYPTSLQSEKSFDFTKVSSHPCLS